MSKPANLEYAFPLTDSGGNGHFWEAVAYRVVGTPYSGPATEYDAVLAPGQDYQSTPGGGTGAVGQYVIFDRAIGDHSGLPGVLDWDPFDPANHVPTSVRYWELQPGSDVMATTLTGLGPVAITDENVGGVIGDIAYVVSGYVYNRTPVALLLVPEFYEGVEILAPGAHTVHLGDRFMTSDSSVVYTVTTPGTVTILPNSGPSLTGGTTVTTALPPGFTFYWPYLERYNLKTKTWLPRVPLPELRVPYTYQARALNADQQIYSFAGPFHLPGGTLLAAAAPNVEGQVNNRFLYSSPDTSGGYAFSSSTIGPTTSPYTEGVYWIATTAFIPPGEVVPQISSAEDAQALGDTLGTRVLDYSNGHYASEGGIAGVIDGKLYFGGGDGSIITSREFFVYDPKTEAFTRLPDCGPNPINGVPDYSVYGVVAGKLFWFGNGHVSSYNPKAGWTHSVYDIADGYSSPPFDQVQGVEISGKLYFVYDRVYVFDPATLMVTAKAAAGVRGPSFLVNGQIRLESNDGGQFSARYYDPISDTWHLMANVVGPPAPFDYDSEFVSVAYRGVPFLFTFEDSNGVNASGVYGLTGNAPPLRYESPTHLTHVGLSPRQAQALQSDVTQMSTRALIQAGFTPRQAKTLQHGDLSLKALIRGGFTTSQAKVLAS